MIREKPAPGLTRDGNGFSDRVMCNRKNQPWP